MIYRYMFTMPFIFLAIFITSFASFRLRLVSKRYSKDRHGLARMSGGELAKKIIRDNGLNVEIVVKKGFLNDYYDATKCVLSLSERSYYGRNIVALATAAHEAGHAMQHKDAFLAMLSRQMMVPVAKLSSKLCIPFIIAGMFLDSFESLTTIGYVMLFLYLAIYLFIIPIEYGASIRAIREIKRLGAMDKKQIRKAKRFLKAAAFTYDAAALTAVVKMLRTRYILMGA